MINHNPDNLKQGQMVMFEGKERKILYFIDEITVAITYEHKIFDVQIKKGLFNRLFRKYEVVERLIPTQTKCSIWNLKPIK